MNSCRIPVTIGKAKAKTKTKTNQKKTSKKNIPMCCQGFHKESCEKVSKGKVFLLHHWNVQFAMRKKL